MKWICMTAPSVAALVLALAAQADSAHEHGSARLDVAVEGNRLHIALQSPLDNLVGFEHAPRNERQRAALAKMEGTLREAGRLFTPDAAARCRADHVEIEHPHGAAAPAADATGHADAQARWTFVCEAPQSLRRLDVQLFDAFRGLRRLKAQTATPRGQGAATLTPARRALAL